MHGPVQASTFNDVPHTEFEMRFIDNLGMEIDCWPLPDVAGGLDEAMRHVPSYLCLSCDEVFEPGYYTGSIRLEN